MATLSDSILLHLGYGTGSYSLPAPTTAFYARLDAIVTDLYAIDAALAAARLDSTAAQVDKLQVNYAQHIETLKSEGTRLLAELAALTCTAIAYNKYQPTSGAGISIQNRTAIRSFY